MASRLTLLPGHKPYTTEQLGQACARALRQASETLESRLSCMPGARQSSGASSPPLLSPTQWRLLGGAVTTSEGLSTWSLTFREGRNYWRVFGDSGADTGTHVIVCISVTSDSADDTPDSESSLQAK